jgi:hypothetical protein
LGKAGIDRYHSRNDDSCVRECLLEKISHSRPGQAR